MFGKGLDELWDTFRLVLMVAVDSHDRVDKLSHLTITEPGYAMPLELWVEAATSGLRIRELVVPLIYLEEKRSFGGELDDAETRLRHYRDVISRSARRHTKLSADYSNRMQSLQS